MAYIPINLLNVTPAQGFTVFPVGLYSLKVTKAEAGMSKASGEPKETITFEIIDGPDGNPQYAGKTMIRSYSLKETALGFFKSLLLALGFTDQFLAQQGGMVAEEQLIGLTLKARVTQREYNGKMQNEVEALLPQSAAPAPAPVAPTAPPAPVVAPQQVMAQAPTQQWGGFTPPAPAPVAAWPAAAPGFPGTAPAPANGGFPQPGFPPAPPPPPRQ